MRDDRFNFWMPVEFEKSVTKKGEKVMRVKGIASTADVDSDGEILEPSGYDLSRLTTSGHINWNHLAKNDPSKIIGEPDVAKIVNNKLYIEGVLYKGHDLAESVWKYAETLNGNNSTRRLGWSVEGRALQRDPMNPKRITKALITNVAITPSPVNASTFVDIVKGTQREDYIEFEGPDPLEKQLDSPLYVYEFEVSGHKYGITKSFEVVDIEKSIKETKEQKVARVMKEWKEGKLKTASGELVTGRDQAIAIALSESDKLDAQSGDHTEDKEKCMDVAATKPLVPESLDKKPKNLEPAIMKAIEQDLLSFDQIVSLVK
jgi:hypothetical protein